MERRSGKGDARDRLCITKPKGESRRLPKLFVFLEKREGAAEYVQQVTDWLHKNGWGSDSQDPSKLSLFFVR